MKIIVCNARRRAVINTMASYYYFHFHPFRLPLSESITFELKALPLDTHFHQLYNVEIKKVYHMLLLHRLNLRCCHIQQSMDY